MIEATKFNRNRIDEALSELLENEDSAVHGYTPASGLPSLRAALADALQQFDFQLAPEQIYVTCGSDAGRSILARALLEEGDEVMFLYPPNAEQYDAMAAAGASIVENGVLTAHTRLVVLSDSDPVPYGLAEMLRAAEKEYGHDIYLLADRLHAAPETEAILRDYDSCIVNEDFGEELAGECIGYLAVSMRAAQADTLCAAIAGAARAAGYVNPPSLMQRAVEACIA